MNSVELEIKVADLVEKSKQAVTLRLHRHRRRFVELLLLDRRHGEGRLR